MRTYVMTLSPGPERRLIHLLPAEAAEKANLLQSRRELRPRRAHQGSPRLGQSKKAANRNNQPPLWANPSCRRGRGARRGGRKCVVALPGSALLRVKHTGSPNAHRPAIRPAFTPSLYLLTTSPPSSHSREAAAAWGGLPDAHRPSWARPQATAAATSTNAAGKGHHPRFVCVVLQICAGLGGRTREEEACPPAVTGGSGTQWPGREETISASPEIFSLGFMQPRGRGRPFVLFLLTLLARAACWSLFEGVSHE